MAGSLAAEMQTRPRKFRDPDLLLLAAAKSRRQNLFWLSADFAPEVVSEEIPERDLVEKRDDYAEARVPEYWIVDPQTETISVCRCGSWSGRTGRATSG